MTPDERQLITGLFDRMQGLGPVQKDREADQIIGDLVRRFPDGPYLLVQSNLIQEQALQQGDQRIRQLEARIADLERQDEPQPQSTGGSFLGGLFGSGSRPAAAPPQRPLASGSVPSAGRPVGQPQQGSVWGSGPPQQQALSAAPPPQQQPWAQPQAPAGGGFMRQAMTTAAGVAGGVLAANAISNMLGGGHAQAAGGGTLFPETHATGEQPAHDQQQPVHTADNNDPGTYDANDPANGNEPGTYAENDADNDPGYTQADDNDPGGDWDGSDDGSTDI